MTDKLDDYGRIYGDKFSVADNEILPVYLLGKCRKTLELVQMSCHIRPGEEIDAKHPEIVRFISDCAPAQWPRK